jgi:hypothetical protein
MKTDKDGGDERERNHSQFDILHASAEAGAHTLLLNRQVQHEVLCARAEKKKKEKRENNHHNYQSVSVFKRRSSDAPEWLQLDKPIRKRPCQRWRR